MADEWLKQQIEAAKIASMQDLFLRNHPEWRERLTREPFPKEQMEREWREWRKKEFQKKGDDDPISLLDLLVGDDEDRS